MDNEIVEKMEESFTLNNLSPRALADFLGLPWPHATDEIPKKSKKEEAAVIDQRKKEKTVTAEQLKKALRKRNVRAFESLTTEVGAK